MIKSAFLFLLGLIFWIYAFEKISTIYLSQYGDPAERARPLLQLDRSLGWRQKPSLDTSFFGAQFKTNELGFRDIPLSSKLDQLKRVLVLGPSSAVGWAVESDQTFSARLEMYSNQLPEGPFSVLNASQIGYSSFQGAKLFNQKWVDTLQPSVVIVSYGINDLDRHRFFFQDGGADRVALSNSMIKKAWRRESFFSNWQILQLFSKLFFKLNESFTCNIFERTTSNRVSLDEYNKNLNQILKRTSSLNAQAIFLSTVYKHKDLHKKSSEELESEANRNEAHYKKARELAMAGDCTKAQSEFYRARSLEPPRIFRDLKLLNAQMQNTAELEGVKFIDLSKVLEYDRDEDFVDPVHFSEVGHIKIAEKVLEMMREK